MNISLTPDLEEYINGKVQSGSYPSASEVIREGLMLLKEREEVHQEKLMDLRREIQVGIDQADRGQVSIFDEATLEEIESAGKLRLAAKKASKPK